MSRTSGYIYNFAFFFSFVAKVLPVIDHFYSADGPLSFFKELGGGELGEWRDFILWEELTLSDCGDKGSTINYQFEC